MMGLKLRTAQEIDVPLIYHFIQQLALYEKEPDAVLATEADILRDGFGERPFFKVLIAEWADKPAGFALYYFNYSTWQGHPGLYLEDIFVLPTYRGKGIGKSMMQQLAQIALENNCTRFEWQVLNWNQSAIQFYESLQAVPLNEWIGYRLEGEGVARLVQNSQ